MSPAASDDRARYLPSQPAPIMTHHDQELAELKELLLLMAGHARNAVTHAIQSLVESGAFRAYVPLFTS